MAPKYRQADNVVQTTVMDEWNSDVFTDKSPFSFWQHDDKMRMYQCDQEKNNEVKILCDICDRSNEKPMKTIE